MSDLYVGLYPEKSTNQWLKNLVAESPSASSENELPFHITLMYCRSTMGTKITLEQFQELSEPDEEYLAFADSVKIWEDHKSRYILVLTIRSSKMLQRHKYWNKLGAVHSYSVWTPHLTLSTELPDYLVSSVEMQEWINETNKQLKHQKVSMLFSGEKAQRIKTGAEKLESAFKKAKRKSTRKKKMAPPMKSLALRPLQIKRPYMKDQRKLDRQRAEKGDELEKKMAQAADKQFLDYIEYRYKKLTLFKNKQPGSDYGIFTKYFPQMQSEPFQREYNYAVSCYMDAKKEYEMQKGFHSNPNDVLDKEKRKKLVDKAEDEMKKYKAEIAKVEKLFNEKAVSLMKGSEEKAKEFFEHHDPLSFKQFFK